MKKTKLGISIIVVILVISVVFAIATTMVLVLNKDKTEEQTINDESTIQNEEVSQETTITKTWIQTVEFPETTNPVEFNLIEGIGSKPPIKVEQFENGKYIFNYFKNGQQSVKKILELPREYIYGVDSLYIEDLEGNSIITLRLDDGEKDLSLYDTLKNDCWSFEVSKYLLEQSLGVESGSDKNETARNLLQKIVDLLGCPTHIYAFGEANVSLNLSNITYYMIYKYDEYVIDVCVQEIGKYEMTNITHITYLTKKDFERWFDDNNKYHNDFYNTNMKDILLTLKQQ